MHENTSAQRLQQIMRERNLKQVDILEMSKSHQKRLGIKLSKGLLSKYVNGKSIPHQNSLHLLSKTLDVDPAWLMGYDLDPENMSTVEITPEDDEKAVLAAKLMNLEDAETIAAIEVLINLEEPQLSVARGMLFSLKKHDDN